MGVGTFIRSRAIDNVLLGFCSERKDLQIVVLGAGFDTRWHRLHNRLAAVHRYVEVDFEEVVEAKNDLLGATPPHRDPRYSLLACDLNESAALVEGLREACVDADRPVLVLAECCLMYMPKDRVRILLEALTAYCRHQCTFVVFDVLFRADAFSSVMVENFSRRGIVLDPLWISTKEDLGQLWPATPPLSFALWDLAEIETSDYLDEGDRGTLRRMLSLDEYEEWRLIGQHYYFAVVDRVLFPASD